MRYLFTVICFLLLIPAAFARQTDQPPMPTRTPLNAESIRAEPVEDGVNLIISGYQPDGCDVPISGDYQVDPQILYVDVMRNPIPPDTFCTMVLQPFEIEVEISTGALMQARQAQIDAQAAAAPELTPEATPEALPDEAAEFDAGAQTAGALLSTLAYIVVNDTAFPATAAFPTLVAVIPSERQPIFVERVNVIPGAREGQFSLEVLGTYASGCEGEDFVRQTVDEDARRIVVDIFRIVPPHDACPAILLMFEGMIPLENEFSGIYEIVVGDFAITYDFDREEILDSNIIVEPQGAQPGRIMTIVENVDALIMESFPPQVNLVVSGYHPDGCRAPVEVEITESGNQITVEIFRLIPPDVMCPMQIVPYEETISLGAFDPGEYMINVNDFTVEVTLQ
jgi:hypothetical protein